MLTSRWRVTNFDRRSVGCGYVRHREADNCPTIDDSTSKLLAERLEVSRPSLVALKKTGEVASVDPLDGVH